MKSYVSMEQQRCFVCGNDFDTGAILLDRRLKESMENHTLTGMGECPECQKQHDAGFYALITIDQSGAATGSNVDKVKMEDACRTGGLIWLRKEAAGSIFNIETQPVMFIDQETENYLKMLAEEAEATAPQKAQEGMV